VSLVDQLNNPLLHHIDRFSDVRTIIIDAPKLTRLVVQVCGWLVGQWVDGSLGWLGSWLVVVKGQLLMPQQHSIFLLSHDQECTALRSVRLTPAAGVRVDATVPADARWAKALTKLPRVDLHQQVGWVGMC